MKKLLLITSLVLSFAAGAQTIKEKERKAELLKSAEQIVIDLSTARESLEKENYELACRQVKDVRLAIHKQIMKFAVHADQFNGKNMTSIRQTVLVLKYLHNQEFQCGQDYRNIDPEQLRQELKDIIKIMKSQKKLIDKDALGESNYFYIEY